MTRLRDSINGTCKSQCGDPIASATRPISFGVLWGIRLARDPESPLCMGRAAVGVVLLVYEVGLASCAMICSVI
eukprot:5515080-Amphidinium_carterae.2